MTSDEISVPVGGVADAGIPVTYVPARNTVFLSIALGYGEVIGATHLFIGANAVDYSGYPDCRPMFIKQFERLANVATAAADGGPRWVVEAPLMSMSKADIIKAGNTLGVDYALTVSCYQADFSGSACGACDACRLRRKGFWMRVSRSYEVSAGDFSENLNPGEITCQISLGRYYTALLENL